MPADKRWPVNDEVLRKNAVGCILRYGERYGVVGSADSERSGARASECWAMRSAPTAKELRSNIGQPQPHS